MSRWFIYYIGSSVLTTSRVQRSYSACDHITSTSIIR